jgi:hypothetical protein
LLQNAAVHRAIRLLAACLIVLVAAACQLLRLPGGDAPSGPPEGLPDSSALEVPIATATEQPMASAPALPPDPTPEVPPPVY